MTKVSEISDIAEGNSEPGSGRSYRGHISPLEYTRAECDGYDNMGRWEFSQHYPAVYRALLRWDQINEAFPSKNKRGRPMETQASLRRKINRAVILYREADGDVDKTAKLMHCSRATALDYLRAGRIIRKNITPELSNDELRTIIKARRKYVYVARAARHIEYSPSIIERIWRQRGLPIKPRGRPRNR